MFQVKKKLIFLIFFLWESRCATAGYSLRFADAFYSFIQSGRIGSTGFRAKCFREKLPIWQRRLRDKLRGPVGYLRRSGISFDYRLSTTSEKDRFWKCSRTALRLLRMWMNWSCSETARNCSETAQKLLWNCSETALKLLLIARKLLWNSSGTALELLWNGSETALKLL